MHDILFIKSEVIKEEGKNCKKIEFGILEGSNNWEARTFYNDMGEMTVEKILLHGMIN